MARYQSSHATPGSRVLYSFSHAIRTTCWCVFRALSGFKRAELSLLHFLQSCMQSVYGTRNGLGPHKPASIPLLADLRPRCLGEQVMCSGSSSAYSS